MDRLRASIVVLCYNGLEEVTIPCLDSIIANTPFSDYELIIVDNASSDGTAQYLKAFSKRYTHTHIHLNEINKGYAGGNNDGIKISKGRCVVLLNNDTLVPVGWLDKLLGLFDAESSIGLIGPVTNSAGNEQRISINGLNEKNYEEVVRPYMERHSNAWFFTDKLGFFCVAMRRNVIEQIGYLDEQFGLGMFEDDDYCVRVKQAGFKMAVVEDCFVYHKGSVSFKKLATKHFIELFQKNRHYFYEKHNILWSYSDIASNIWGRIRDQLISMKDKNDSFIVERVMCRLDNMTDALHQLREVEHKSTVIGEHLFIETQLAEKHRTLMEMSEWATQLKKDNETLIAQLEEKQAMLMELSDWASSMKQDLDLMARSYFYRIFRFFQRRGM